MGGNIQTGNITGAGIIVGNDIHIDGDFIVQTSDKAISLGLNLLPPKYFQTRSIGDLENWKKGFEFELPDIMAGLEFKREKLLTDIIKKLDDNNSNSIGGHTVLLLGRSGTSKSTILMELICHYFKEQYIVLYNFGEEKINNVFGIVNFIESKLNEGKVDNKENKILVAVDNVHNERTASIFSVIDQLDNHIKKDNIRFVLSARQPEFDRFIEDRLNTLPGEISSSINKLTNDATMEFEIKPFNEGEIAGFIRKYENAPELLDSVRRIGFNGSDLNDEKKLKEVASQIYNETEGDPILVKFLLFGEGLLQDVKKRYRDYLAGNEDKLTTAIICSILNRTGLLVTTSIMDCMKLTKSAEELTGYIITFLQDTNTWKTIHPAWDLEFLSYLLTSSNDIAILNGRKRLIRNALSTLLSCITNEEDRYYIFGGLYDSTSIEIEKKKMPVDILDEIITKPDTFVDKLSDGHRVALYALYVGPSFDNSQRYDDAIRYYNKVIELDPNYKDAWYNKGVTLGNQGNYDHAIISYDKVIGLDPNYKDAWYNKAEALGNQGKYGESILSYNKVIELDPTDKDAWNNKAVALGNQGKYGESILSYNKVIELDPTDKDAWYNKGVALGKQGHEDQAIICYDKAIELDPNYKDAWYNKGVTLGNQGNYGESILSYNKVITLDPTYKDAWYNKAEALGNQGNYDKAIESYDKVIALDSTDKDAWYNKGNTLDNQGHYDQAIICYDKAIELDSNYKEAWNNKAVILDNQGNYDKAIESYDKVIALDPTDKDALYNKAVILDNQGNYGESILSYNKIIELDPNYKDAWDGLGYIHYKMGDTDKAVEAVDKAIKIDPKYANGWYNKSIYMIKEGKIDEAISYLKRAVELDTNYAEQARDDGDFDAIRNDTRFIELVGNS